VPEATNENEELFGTERMLAALNSYQGEDPAQILTAVHQAVDAFVGDAEQFDDLTMLCQEYKGNVKPGNTKQE
jgi:sigma-B regulation protein RsbU (phosphoserine phosphatase)